MISAEDKQPRGLSTLFFTELWERFGFYTVQTIIILYLVKKVLFTDQEANNLAAAFNAVLYLTPAIGGYLADRYLGFRRAVYIGAFLLLIGYVLLSLPGLQIFYLGLGVLIAGNGLLKPNISSIVGDLYYDNDPRRQGGFTLFYMGINIGSLIPPLIVHAVVVKYGWHAGFSLAALGMAIALVTFFLGSKTIRHIGKIPSDSVVLTPKRIRFYSLLVIGLLASIGLFYLAMRHPQVTDTLVGIAAVVLILIITVILWREPVRDRHRMLAILALIVISIGFWALYNQTFTSLMLFADRNMQPDFLGFHITAEFTQFFNPFFIILASPFLSRLWIKLDHKKRNPSIPLKFAFGVGLMFLGFAALVVGTQFFAVANKVSVWWLVLSYLLQTMGELLLSPIGLSMITELAPDHLVGMMMGVWFFAQAGAFALGGVFANLAAAPKLASLALSLSIYQHAFTVLMWLSLALAVVSFILWPFLRRLIATE